MGDRNGFNHARAWRATSDPIKDRTKSKFQSTPAHGGRPGMCVIARGVEVVSIHARAWRATHMVQAGQKLFEFQSTPAHGGRPKTTWRFVQVGRFNPRP